MMPWMMTLAQNTGGGGTVGGVGTIFVVLLQLLIFVVVIAAFWKVFVKAGHPGWASLIPIYNIYILCKIAGRPGWWVVLCFIPIINLIALVIISLDIAKAFGKSALFAVGLFLLSPIFYAILGFGPAQYQGPAAR